MPKEIHNSPHDCGGDRTGAPKVTNRHINNRVSRYARLATLPIVCALAARITHTRQRRASTNASAPFAPTPSATTDDQRLAGRSKHAQTTALLDPRRKT